MVLNHTQHTLEQDEAGREIKHSDFTMRSRIKAWAQFRKTMCELNRFYRHKGNKNSSGRMRKDLLWRQKLKADLKHFFCSWRAECEEQRKYIVSTRNRLSTCGWPWITSVALASPVSSLRQFNGQRSNSRDLFDRGYLRDLLTGWSQAVAAPLSGKNCPSQVADTLTSKRPLCPEVQGMGRTHQNERINELMW